MLFKKLFGLAKTTKAPIWVITVDIKVQVEKTEVIEAADSTDLDAYFHNEVEAQGDVHVRMVLDERGNLAAYKVEPLEVPTAASVAVSNATTLVGSPNPSKPPCPTLVHNVQGCRLNAASGLKSDLKQAVPVKCDAPTSASPVLKADQFRTLRVLGQGGQGMVLLVEYNATGQLYALKVIKKNSLSTEDLRTVFVEQDVMKTLNGNPFFTSLKGSFEDEDNFFLLMDWHIGGDLDARIKEEGRLSTDEARSYAAQIIIGMEELHRQRIIHRDIKPKNILLNAQHEVIITDFGLSRMFGRTVDEQPWRAQAIWQQREDCPDEKYWLVPSALVVDKTDSTCGTATHMSPELFVNMGYSYSLDHWAFAVTLYEMLYGKLPFIPENAASFEEFVIRVRHEAVKVDDKAVDRDANDLLQMMLDKDLHRRPTWAQIKKHKWFNSIDWDRLAHRKPHLAPYAPKNLKTERHARGIAFGKPCEAEYPWLEWAAPEFKATTTASISTKVSKKFLTPASTTSRHASDNDLVHTASTASRQAPAPLAKHTPSSSAGVAQDSGASYCTVSLTSQLCSRKGSFTAYAPPPRALRRSGFAGGHLSTDEAARAAAAAVAAVPAATTGATTTVRSDALISGPIGYESTSSYFLSDARPTSRWSLDALCSGVSGTDHYMTSLTTDTEDWRATACCSLQTVALESLLKETSPSDAHLHRRYNTALTTLDGTHSTATSTRSSATTRSSSLSIFSGNSSSSSAEDAFSAPGSGSRAGSNSSVPRSPRSQWQDWVQPLRIWWTRRGVKEVRRVEGGRIDLLD